MTRILSREGAEPRVSGFFFKAVVQAMLLFGLETWVVIPRTGWALGEFQYQVARRLMGGGGSHGRNLVGTGSTPRRRRQGGRRGSRRWRNKFSNDRKRSHSILLRGH